MTNALVQRLFDIDLWFVGAAHFLILLASFQVPYRLAWKRDLQQLMPFNRKLLWVQSGFTVLTIISFGTLTLALHRELLRGDRSALGSPASSGFTGLRGFLSMRSIFRTPTGPREQHSSWDTLS
jgi:hypothetical protein